MLEKALPLLAMGLEIFALGVLGRVLFGLVVPSQKSTVMTKKDQCPYCRGTGQIKPGQFCTCPSGLAVKELTAILDAPTQSGQRGCSRTAT